MYALGGQGQKETNISSSQGGSENIGLMLVTGYFKKGHEIAKADRKHRWIRAGTVQLPPVGKFAKMVEGKSFMEGNK